MKQIISALLVCIVLLAIGYFTGYQRSKWKSLDDSTKAIKEATKMRDYQIELDMDTVFIYEGDRLVGRFTSRFNSQYDSVFLKDNE